MGSFAGPARGPRRAKVSSGTGCLPGGTLERVELLARRQAIAIAGDLDSLRGDEVATSNGLLRQSPFEQGADEAARKGIAGTHCIHDLGHGHGRYGARLMRRLEIGALG